MSTAKFREWRASRGLCFIVDLLILDPLNPHLSANILRDYALEIEVRVKSTPRDLKEFLTKAIKDGDCFRELLDATMEDNDEMGKTYEIKLATFRVELEQRSLAPLATKVE